MSVLKPEGSIVAGLATAALVYGVYQMDLPPMAVVGATEAHDANIESARKKAAWTTAAMVAGVSLLARDKTIFILGGGILVILDWHARHANAVHPATGEIVNPPAAGERTLSQVV